MCYRSHSFMILIIANLSPKIYINNNTLAKKRSSLAFAEIAQHKTMLDYYGDMASADRLKVTSTASLRDARR
jgi:hypothetical protein